MKHREIGSVEGHVKAVERCRHNQPLLVLTTRIDGRDIEIVGNEVDASAIIPGMRIRAHGLMFYKTPELLERILAERVEVFKREDRLPGLDDLIDEEGKYERRIDG